MCLLSCNESIAPFCHFTILLFQVAIRALGFEVKKADVLKILKDYDKEGKGKITFQDFNEISKSTVDLALSPGAFPVFHRCFSHTTLKKLRGPGDETIVD